MESDRCASPSTRLFHSCSPLFPPERAAPERSHGDIGSRDPSGAAVLPRASLARPTPHRDGLPSPNQPPGERTDQARPRQTASSFDVQQMFMLFYPCEIKRICKKDGCELQDGFPLVEVRQTRRLEVIYLSDTDLLIAASATIRDEAGTNPYLGVS